MKKHILFLTTLLILSPLLSAQDDEANKESNPDRLVVTFSNSEPRFLNAHLMNGNITVIGYDGDEVIIEAEAGTEFHNGNGQPRIREDGFKVIRMSSTGLYVEEKDNHIEVGSKNMQDNVDVVIKVPFDTNLQLKCMNNGDILVENVNGEINSENLNGDITLENVSGVIVTHALNGDVMVTLTEVTPDMPMSFTSLNGDIDITLPENTAARLKMKTFQGDVVTNFDVSMESHEKNTPTTNDDRQSGGRYRQEYVSGSIFGTINGGGPLYVFSSHNGDITIRKNEAE